jgi:hypothetical protein
MEESERGAEERGSRFMALPSTVFGKWSAWLMVASVALLVLNTAVVLPIVERDTGLELPRLVFVSVIFGCVVAMGVTGIYALVAKRERSWAVMLSAVLFVVAMGFMLSDILFPE